MKEVLEEEDFFLEGVVRDGSARGRGIVDGDGSMEARSRKHGTKHVSDAFGFDLRAQSEEKKRTLRIRLHHECLDGWIKAKVDRRLGGGQGRTQLKTEETWFIFDRIAQGNEGLVDVCNVCFDGQCLLEVILKHLVHWYRRVAR